jgi:hypothetical protein
VITENADDQVNYGTNGDDEVYFHAKGKQNRIRLGHGQDNVFLLGS